MMILMKRLDERCAISQHMCSCNKADETQFSLLYLNSITSILTSSCVSCFLKIQFSKIASDLLFCVFCFYKGTKRSKISSTDLLDNV